MQNARDAGMRFAGAITLSAALALAGCANDTQSKQQLTEGYGQLDAGQYDAAIASADATIASSPNGGGVAEADYLKGRALEQKTASNPAQSRANWQAARLAYIDGLSHSPPQKLEALLHSGLANVAYFQDDYTTAASEWTAAYDKFDDVNSKAWVLYRIGLSRQRLGQFTDADAVFAAVAQRFPETEPARRAQAHSGARGFSVQFGTYGAPGSADQAVTTLRQQGVTATRRPDANGRSVVSSGPLPSYQQAVALKTRFAGSFRDAIIVP